MKIILATDGSKFSQAAAQYLARLPIAAATSVMVVSVAEVPIVAAEVWTMSPGLNDELVINAHKAANAAIEQAATQLRTVGLSKDVDLQTQVLEGSTADAIITFAEDWQADLIVVGSHGYSAIKRFLLGSVSNAVLTHAPCSVLIVRVPTL